MCMMVFFTSGLLLFLATLLFEFSSSSGLGVPLLDGFQPPELDGSPVTPVCRVVTATPPLPVTVVPVPPQPPSSGPPRPPPDPGPKTKAPPNLQRSHLLSLLIFLLANQRDRAVVMGTSHRHAVLPWRKVLSQDRGGARLPVRAGAVQALAWSSVLQKSSESDSSEEIRV